MSVAQFDVVVVGAGCAGLTAAIGLARAGFTVAVLEAAPLPGSGGIGGVFFAQSLSEPDLLGPQGVEALTWERRLIERGHFATDGRHLTGCTYRDPDAFHQCFTVLTSLFDHHLAQLAISQGVSLLTETAAEGLIREGRHAIGVATSRGPVYGDLVFLAEGDAGHLVSREGYDRFGDPRETPGFLYCLQQVIELPPGAIEECFQVGPEQGVAHDLLLRNPDWAALNARGFVCTNRQSVTLSVVLPVENLRQHFNGQPLQLLDWFADMPALRPWWREGRRGAWTARLVRDGGLRDVPYLVEDGLAVGGAAAGLSIDFPVLNSTGPATLTGLFLSRAVRRIRSEGGHFDREQLRRYYVEPLRQTRCWRDMEFLQRWPGYVRRTRVLFDRELDLLLDSAAVWTRPRRWLPRKLLNWFRVLGRVRWAQWGEFADDLLDLGHALRLREVTPRPALARVLLDGALNAFRDLVRRPRPHLPPGGALRLHYFSPHDGGTVSATPALMRRWFARFQPVLSSMAHIVHCNNDKPLSARMTAMVDLLIRQVNLMDLLAIAGMAFVTALGGTLLDALGWVFRRLGRRDAAFVAPRTLSEGLGDADRPSDDRRSRQMEPLIHIVWRSTRPRERVDAVRRLPHICPAGVFQTQGELPAGVRVRVRAERCIACEACWRLNPAVDWGTLEARPLRAAVLSPLLSRLLEAEDRAGLTQPSAPRRVDSRRVHRKFSGTLAHVEAGSDLVRLLEQLDWKLSEFEESLVEGPAAVDRPRGDHLEMLARYAQQFAVRIHEVLQESAWLDDSPMRLRARHLAEALLTKTEERARRTWDGRFAWAVADGRLLRQHHLAGLRRLVGLDAIVPPRTPDDPSRALRRDWIPEGVSLRAEDACIKHLLADIAARRYLLETLEVARPPEKVVARAELLAVLTGEVREGLIARIAELDAVLERTTHAPPRDPHRDAETYARHGPALLADPERLRSLLDISDGWQTMAQRRVLQAEREEILKAEERLAALANVWRDGEDGREDEAEVSAGFARQAACVLADKQLLLQTFHRLEAGLDAELAIALLRVRLDYTATLLDEFTILVRQRLRRTVVGSDRPLVEFGSGPPPKTLAEYLADAAPYTSGDFLLAPINLLQPRLVPEMIHDTEEIAALAKQASPYPLQIKDKRDTNYGRIDVNLAELARAAADLPDWPWSGPRRAETCYLIEALSLEALGRRAHPHTRSLDLEWACARLLATESPQRGGGFWERCAILQALTDEVMPRWLKGGVETRVRHLGRDVLDLEALKADFRRRLAAAWHAFGEALGRNPDVQASCFALAEATAWLKAADSTLGRMGWLSRLSEAEEREEPAPRQEIGRRVLAHCHAEVRDRLFRFDEDLAALRRGYYAPPVRAALLLLIPERQRPAPAPISDIKRSIRVLVVVEPLPAVLPQTAEGGEFVLESHWTLDAADRAAVENALRLRDAAPDFVSIDVAAVGPPRVGQALREVLSLGIEHVRLLVPDRVDRTPEGAAAVLATSLESPGPFDLILGAHRATRLTTLVAEAFKVPTAGHAVEVSLHANADQACLRLWSAGGHPPRERPLPAAVLIEAGTSLRPYTIAGYLAGLSRSVQTVNT